MGQHTITLAGIPLDCTFLYENTAELFGSYCDASEPVGDNICITKAGWEYWDKYFGYRGAKAEFNLLSMYLSSALLKYKRCVFHAAAFSVEGKAWLISAPPGTGKSTQLKTLKQLYPEKITTICGDRPVLELTDDGKVNVHPSPWNGKEGWSGDSVAPLAGIVLLKRGKENELIYVPRKKASMMVFTSLLKSAENKDDIYAVASFEDELLQRTHIWFLENKDVPESTKLLYEELLSRETVL